MDNLENRPNKNPVSFLVRDFYSHLGFILLGFDTSELF